MGDFIFKDLPSILYPIGAFAVILAIFQFGFAYAREGLFQLLLPKPTAKRIYRMLNKTFGFFAYVTFVLLVLTGIWIMAGIGITLWKYFNGNADKIPFIVVLVCFSVIFSIIIVSILMLIRARKGRKGLLTEKEIDDNEYGSKKNNATAHLIVNTSDIAKMNSAQLEVFREVIDKFHYTTKEK